MAETKKEELEKETRNGKEAEKNLLEAETSKVHPSLLCRHSRVYLLCL